MNNPKLCAILTCTRGQKGHALLRLGLGLASLLMGWIYQNQPEETQSYKEIF